MTDPEFHIRLCERAAAAGLEVPHAVTELLTRYWRFLSRWTLTINLTSLQLDPPSDEAIDRLFIEPVAAVRFFPAGAVRWYDLGSGGGSPAIPMKICLPKVPLVMVESRERKAVFLREASRELRLQGVDILNARFEAVAAKWPHSADVVTVRAVRPDQALSSAVRMLLTVEGRLMLFQTSDKPLDLGGLYPVAIHQLLRKHGSTVGLYVPRGTHNDQQ